jgi:pilus assembly protein CpaB
MQSRVLAILVAVVLALVATAALVVYVNGADRRAIADQEPVQVLVAIKPIKAGTSAENAVNLKMIDDIEIPRKNAIVGGVRSVNQIENRLAAVDIVEGEQLLLDRWVGASDIAGRGLLQIPVDHQALSIGLDLTRQVAGFVTPGDNVTMFVTMKRGEGEGTDQTNFLLQNIRVLAVGTTALTNPSSQGGGGRVNQGRGSQTLTAVTLAIPQTRVREVVFAAEHGSIYLSLLPRDAKRVPANGPITAGNAVPPSGAP